MHITVRQFYQADGRAEFVGWVSLVIIKREKCFSHKVHTFQIRLIDTGKILDREIQCIYEYCGKQRKFFDLPPRCFKCSLAEVQPSQIRNPNGVWPNEAIALFEKLTSQKSIEIEVWISLLKLYIHAIKMLFLFLLYIYLITKNITACAEILFLIPVMCFLRLK